MEVCLIMFLLLTFRRDCIEAHFCFHFHPPPIPLVFFGLLANLVSGVRHICKTRYPITQGYTT